MRILKFYTKSCGQCKVVTNMLDNAGIQHEAIDCEENEELVKKYNIMHVPSVIIESEDGGMKKLNNITDVKQWLINLTHQKLK